MVRDNSYTGYIVASSYCSSSECDSSYAWYVHFSVGRMGGNYSKNNSSGQVRFIRDFE